MQSRSSAAGVSGGATSGAGAGSDSAQSGNWRRARAAEGLASASISGKREKRMPANPLQLKRLGPFPNTPLVRDMRRTAADLGIVQLLGAALPHVKASTLPQWVKDYIEEARDQLMPPAVHRAERPTTREGE